MRRFTLILAAVAAAIFGIYGAHSDDFTGQAPKDTYKKILHIDQATNMGLDTTLRDVHAGDGTVSKLQLSTTKVNIAVDALQIAGTDVSATAAELNILDGATLTTAELNVLAGATLTDGGPLIGGGTNAITAMAVLADQELIVGDGVGAPAILAIGSEGDIIVISDGALAWNGPAIIELSDGSLSSPSLSFASDTDTGIYRTGDDQFSLIADSVEGIRVTSTGINIFHTASEADDHALEIDVDAAGFGDVKGLNIDYITGAVGAGSDDSIILVNIDESAATGGEVHALEVLATTGSATVEAIHAGVGVTPLHQSVGTFGDMDSALVNAVDRLAEFISTGSDIAMFVADNDTVTIGDAAKFGEIEFLLATVASGAGVKPTFEYSTGVGTWSAAGVFVPTDGTNGLRNSGIIDYDPANLAGWVVGTGSKYLIQITRTANGLGTVPIEDLVQIAATTDYTWDASGNLSINDLTVSGAGVVLQGTHVIWVPAGAMRPTVSNGAAAITDVETTSGRPDMQVIDFDASADEHVQFNIMFPSSWDESTITFRCVWASAGAVSTGVAIALQGLSVSDNVTIDAAYGAAVVVTDDAQGAVEEAYVTAESGAVTIGGTPVADDITFFRLFRDVDDANDDMTQDMRLIGCQLLYTIDAENDT